MKFGRDYVLTVGVGPYGPPMGASGAIPVSEATSSIEIKPPYTLELSIERAFWSQAQTATLRIKNLSADKRDMIYRDPFAFQYYSEVRLQAGYQGQFLPTIFWGQIKSASSHREGRKDMVTEIEAFDGGFARANSFSCFNLPADHSFSDAITRLNGDLSQISGPPLIGSVPQTLGPRPTVFVGPTFSLIQKMLPTNVRATIDTNQLKVLAVNDAFQNGDFTFTIEAASGLLDPPVRTGNGISCTILFEPRMAIGLSVNLVSADNPKFNGNYVVVGLSHQAIISPAEGGPATTKVQLFNPGKLNVLTGGLTPSASTT